MYATGDFIASGQPFNTDSWGPKTAQFMDHITKDLGEKHWDSIFSSLYSFSTRIAKEEAIDNGVPLEGLGEHVPLPSSDPPSSPRDD
jgi:hypothetical protein